MFRFITSFGSIALIAVVAVLTIQRQSPAPTEWLVFTNAPNGNLYRIHTVSKNAVKVSTLEIGPATLSPDRHWLLFTTQSDNGRSLMKAPTLDVDSTQLVWDGDGHPLSPSWSFDNEWIAFVRAHDVDNNLFIVKPDGSEYRQISAAQLSTDAPVWSLDSKWLYYSASVDRDSVIFRSNIYTGETEIFLRAAASPAISPDGTRLAYLTHVGSQKFVTIIDIETRGLITQVPFFSLSPFWSEDGTTVYVSDFRDGNLWEFNLTTKQDKQLTSRSEGNIYAQLWDGDCIIAEEVTHGAMEWEIHLLRICGQNTTLLTSGFDLAYQPFWLPHVDESWHPWVLTLGSIALASVSLILRRR